MTTAHPNHKQTDGWFLSDQLLAAERSLRTHPTVVGIAVIVTIIAITLVKLRVPDSLSLALSYTLPVALCGYGLGLVANLGVSVVVSYLWVLEAMEAGGSFNELWYVFTARMVLNLGIVAIAAMAAAAARARERYLTTQQELIQLQADLVSAFSHDLRNPLMTIAGYAEMLRDKSEIPQPVDPEIALDTIVAQVHRLDRLIGDMLGVAQSDASPVLQLTTCEVEALVSELRAEFDHTLHSTPVDLQWQVQPGIPALKTDRNKLVSIVRNLVGNAIKFTERGSVQVHMGYDQTSDTVRIGVEDTGRGIAPDALPHLFDRFYRAPGAHTVDGFGLGLFIVKRFTELLGGSISVDAGVGRGTRFVVTIPRLAVSDSSPVVRRRSGQIPAES